MLTFGGCRKVAPRRLRSANAARPPSVRAEAQDLMLDYLATTDATGALPLYNPDTYARALQLGRVPGRHATDGT